jgi:hypothetical protein
MKDKSVPDVEKISALITVLKLYIDTHTVSCNNPQPEYACNVPCLASWDALDWYRVIQDIEVIDFLISGTKAADRLIRSLQSCIQWQIHTEANNIREHSRINN